MKKTDIFKDIIWIMTHDSSTVKDRKGCNPQPFLEKITDDMAEQEFLYQVRAYLATHLAIHLSFSGRSPIRAPGPAEWFPDIPGI